MRGCVVLFVLVNCSLSTARQPAIVIASLSHDRKNEAYEFFLCIATAVTKSCFLQCLGNAAATRWCCTQSAIFTGRKREDCLTSFHYLHTCFYVALVLHHLRLTRLCALWRWICWQPRHALQCHTKVWLEPSYYDNSAFLKSYLRATRPEYHTLSCQCHACASIV